MSSLFSDLEPKSQRIGATFYAYLAEQTLGDEKKSLAAIYDPGVSVRRILMAIRDAGGTVNYRVLREFRTDRAARVSRAARIARAGRQCSTSTL